MVAFAGSNIFPETPVPDQKPDPSVDVIRAVFKLIGAFVTHCVFILPVMVAGTNCSIEIVDVCEALQVADPTVYV